MLQYVVLVFPLTSVLKTTITSLTEVQSPARVFMLFYFLPLIISFTFLIQCDLGSVCGYPLCFLG